MLRKRLQLRRERAGQACFSTDDRWCDLKSAGLHSRMDLRRPLPTVGTVMATQEGLEPDKRDRLQSLAGREGPQQRERDRSIGICEQRQKLREIRLQTGGQLITEHGARPYQLRTVARQRP